MSTGTFTSDPHPTRARTHIHLAVPVPDTGRERRALWDDAGIALDDVSSTVLVAGLRIVTEGPVRGRASPGGQIHQHVGVNAGFGCVVFTRDGTGRWPDYLTDVGRSMVVWP